MRLDGVTTVLGLTLVLTGCRPVIPLPARPDAGVQAISGRGWSFAVPRGWSAVHRPAAVVEVREPRGRSRSEVRVVLLRGRVPFVVGRYDGRPLSAVEGLDEIGVRSGPGERTVQRVSSSGAVGLTLRCTAPEGREHLCDAILGTFRTAP